MQAACVATAIAAAKLLRHAAQLSELGCKTLPHPAESTAAQQPLGAIRPPGYVYLCSSILG